MEGSEKKLSESLNGVDLFAGAGGLSLGAMQAGVKIHVAVEADTHAADTYAYNHPDVEVLAKPVEKIKKKDLRIDNKSSILFGGPPCQGFSTSNQRTRNPQNQLNWLYLEFIRIARAWQPDWIVLENVRGICETRKGLFFRAILDGLNNLGYTNSWWVLNAADFGVPQKRQRLFIVGSRHGLKVDAPKPQARSHITVREAISDLPFIENGASFDRLPYRYSETSKYAKLMRGRIRQSSNHLVSLNAPLIVERYKYIPPGGNWTDIPSRLMKNYTNPGNCHTGIYHRLQFDEPSIVIGNYRKNMLIHPEFDRGLSVREAARLQSFPDWYEFKGSIGFQQQQVGNAVPPLLAKAVFSSVLKAHNSLVK